MALEITNDIVVRGLALPVRLEIDGWLKPSVSKIELMKWVRTYTNAGLADAKNFVEAFNLPNDAIKFKLAIKPIFDAYRVEIFTDEEKKTHPLLKEVQQNALSFEQKRILTAVAAAMDSWEPMGFPSPLAAVKCAIDNLHASHVGRKI